MLGFSEIHNSAMKQTSHVVQYLHRQLPCMCWHGSWFPDNELTHMAASRTKRNLGHWVSGQTDRILWSRLTVGAFSLGGGGGGEGGGIGHGFPGRPDPDG